jgi:hypothetical protein
VLYFYYILFCNLFLTFFFFFKKQKKNKNKIMDVEARRKFCGLLMFDVPTISSKSSTSRNNDIIINNMPMREIDPSSLNNFSYESSHSLDHQFVMQDGMGDFSTSTRALAAGAAAGGNQDDDSSNVVDGDNNGNSKSQPQKRTPRPPNAFILYRRAKQPAIIASQRNLTNAEVSRTISDMWRKEPEEIRLEWERYADRKKLEHMQTYPNYVYRPNKNKSKVDKRRQQRRQTASKESSSSSNSPIENKSTNSGPVRRKSSKNANVKPPTKLDMSMNNGMTGYNVQQSINQQSSLLPSPEIPLLTTHFTEQPNEFVNSQSQLTPVTPLTPHTPLTPISTPEQMQRDHDFKIQNNLLRLVPVEELTYQQQQHHQGNFSFQPISGLTPYHNNHTQTVDPLEFFVPDVAQQQQQMFAEIMLHHEHHHITPTATVPSSNSASIPASTIPYFNGTSTAAHTFTDMLGFELNFLGSSVNHQNGNGLEVSADQYLQ